MGIISHTGTPQAASAPEPYQGHINKWRKMMEKMEARVACLKMAVEVAPEIRRTEISAGADKYAGKDMVVIMHIAHSFEEFTHTGKIPEGLILEKLEITPEMLAITKRILQLLEQRSK